VANDNDQGDPLSEKETVRWYRVAANQSDADAQFSLGTLHWAGRGGLPQDGAEAARWYRLAADAGHDAAQFNLSAMHANSQGVPPDDAEDETARDRATLNDSAMTATAKATNTNLLASRLESHRVLRLR